jgi:18S rRNA (guanine1575-N7)-methyltransferase
MRPEHENPPEIFYNDREAQKYTENSRIREIQVSMTERALELLELEDRKCLILDIGSGSGLSGETITENGHVWIGMDISLSMLKVAQDREVEGDLLLQDIGEGLGFRPGSFDGAVSISCLQWLCNADHKSHIPKKRLNRFFNSLFVALRHGAKAVLQFYPENDEQMNMITSCALKAGFTGGVVVDFPESTRKKKYFLTLSVGGTLLIPQGLTDDSSTSRNISQKKMQKKRGNVKDRDWVLRKKEARRRKGDIVPPDTKYTARKRRVQF